MIPRLTLPHRESRSESFRRAVSSAAYHIQRECWWSVLGTVRLAGNARQIVHEASWRAGVDRQWVELQLRRELARVRNP